MQLRKRLRRYYFLLAYFFYARPKITKIDTVDMFDLSLVIAPTVFHPALYFSSEMLGSHIAELPLRGKTVLDLGCGSGIHSLIAASGGAIVTSIDINPRSVEATI